MILRSGNLVASLLTTLCVVFFIAAGNRAPTKIIDGFEIDTLATNLRVPWQITFLPDQTMLFTEREGRLRVYRNGKLLPKPAFTAIDVVLRNKTGVLGLCIHPD
ncbi:MAG: hypothetical protein EOO92_06345 [Pedobacter sp.]|nr:MAG: hypothetical protein EOO92_06345 [Pedobacter sp.]